MVYAMHQTTDHWREMLRLPVNQVDESCDVGRRNFESVKGKGV